jgi:hypothetical protein
VVVHRNLGHGNIDDPEWLAQTGSYIRLDSNEMYS